MDRQGYRTPSTNSHYSVLGTDHSHALVTFGTQQAKANKLPDSIGADRNSVDISR